MSTVLDSRGLAESGARPWRPWFALAIGIAVLYVPTYIGLSRGLWRDDAYAHGPIILAVFAWLVWRSRAVLLEDSGPRAPLSGSLLFAAALALYVVGRSQALPLLEAASHLPLVAGILLLMRGYGAVRRLWFPLVFLAFVIPVPGFVLDGITAPLKNLVSAIVEMLLYSFGYPIARTGVVLDVGQYQMLVADACSGLNSLYSLFALTLLYLFLTPPARVLRAVLVLAALIPIAVIANLVRVLVLVLVTYHLGDEAGQGFLHNFAGLLVFVVALLLLFGFDALVRRALPARAAAAREPAGRPRARVSLLSAAVATFAMVAAAAAAPMLAPKKGLEAVDLESMVPHEFQGWRLDADVVPIPPAPDVQANLDRLYSQVLSRTYVNDAGERMMLTIAYGGDQSDALKAHRQETCYAAQGFEIRTLAHGELSAASRTIPVTRMHAVRGTRSEPVTYWFTMGDRVVLSRLERFKVQLSLGLAGRMPDGMLVRVSSLSADPSRAYLGQAAFTASLLSAMPAADVRRLVGAAETP